MSSTVSIFFTRIPDRERTVTPSQQSISNITLEEHNRKVPNCRLRIIIVLDNHRHKSPPFTLLENEKFSLINISLINRTK